MYNLERMFVIIGGNIPHMAWRVGVGLHAIYSGVDTEGGSTGSGPTPAHDDQRLFIDVDKCSQKINSEKAVPFVFPYVQKVGIIKIISDCDIILHVQK
jgi:hypothetical protein